MDVTGRCALRDDTGVVMVKGTTPYPLVYTCCYIGELDLRRASSAGRPVFITFRFYSQSQSKRNQFRLSGTRRAIYLQRFQTHTTHRREITNIHTVTRDRRVHKSVLFARPVEESDTDLRL